MINILDILYKKCILYSMSIVTEKTKWQKNYGNNFKKSVYCGGSEPKGNS